MSDDNTPPPRPFRLQVRLEAKEGKPIKQFYLTELQEPTYEALAQKVIAMTFSYDDEHAIELDSYNLTLTYEGSTDWWISIEKTDDLSNAILDVIGQGFLKVKANVQKKFALPAVVRPAVASPSVVRPSVDSVPSADFSKLAPPQDDSMPGTPLPDPSLANSMPGATLTACSQANPMPGATLTALPQANSIEGVTLTSPFHANSVPGMTFAAPSQSNSVQCTLTAPSQVTPPRKRKKTATVKRCKRVKLGEEGKKPVSERIVSALAELRVLKIIEPPRVQVALFSGYTNVKSAGYAKALSQLKGMDLIEYPSNTTVRLTAKGEETVKAVDAPKDNAAVHERLKLLLKPTTIKVFDVLRDGRPHRRTDVATATNYTNEKSAGFAKALSTMSSLGILQYLRTEQKETLVQLTDIAFPYGRP